MLVQSRPSLTIKISYSRLLSISGAQFTFKVGHVVLKHTACMWPHMSLVTGITQTMKTKICVTEQLLGMERLTGMINHVTTIMLQSILKIVRILAIEINRPFVSTLHFHLGLFGLV